MLIFPVFLLQIRYDLLRSRGHQRADGYRCWWNEQPFEQWNTGLTDSVLKTWKLSTFCETLGRTTEEMLTNQEQGKEENMSSCLSTLEMWYLFFLSIVLTFSRGSLCDCFYELRSVTWSEDSNRTTITQHIQDKEVALSNIFQIFLRIPLEIKNASSLYAHFVKCLLSSIQILTILESFADTFMHSDLL